MKRWALGLGGVVLLGTLGACSSEDGQKPHATTLTLTSDGATGDLRLQIVPLHPSYTASYPNPQAVSKMVVTVDGQGLFNAICTTNTGDNVDCEDHPFFSAVTRTQDGTSSNVHIYDLFGAEIASNDYPTNDTGTSDGVSGGDNGSGTGAGTTGGTNDGSGSGGTGSGTGTGTGTGGSGTGSGTTTTNTGGTSDSTGGTTVIVGGTTTVTKGGTVINTGGAVTIHGGTTTETGGTTTATQDGVTTTNTGGTTTVVGGTTTEHGGVVTVTGGSQTTTGGSTTTDTSNGSTTTVGGTTTITGGTTDNRGGTTATSGGTISPVGSGSGTSGSGTSGGGSGSGSTSGGSSGSGSGSGSSCGSGGSGSGSGSGHTCDTTHEKAARDAFCAKINQLLAQNNFTSRLDCNKLDDVNYVQATLPQHRTGGRCQDFWGPAQQEVHGHYAECYGNTNQWIQRSRWELIHDGVCRASPLVLDLDGDGVHLTGVDKGVTFDLFADGDRVKTGWVDGKDGLLALDRNGNGTIDSAAELFGTVTGGEKLSDGFAALAEIDANGDGFVDARDPAFGELRVWRDANHDGVSQPSELLTLREAGVKRLLVDAHKTTGVSSVDANGNDVPLVGGFVRADGTTGQMVDAFFRFTF